MALTPGMAGLTPRTKTQRAAETTSRTWRIDFASGRVRGMTDGREAMEQAIYMILNTERFAHLIFSWNYGAEMSRTAGRSGEELESELRRIISEALLADGRITGVRDFAFARTGRRTMEVSFAVDTTAGEIAVTRRVEI